MKLLTKTKSIPLIVCIFLSAPFLNISLAQNGNSLEFNGATDYISVDDHNAIDFDSNFTIEAWINPDPVSSSMTIVSKGWCDGNDKSYVLNIKAGKIDWRWSNDGFCNLESWIDSRDSVITPGVCTHIAVVHTPDTVRMFVNGTEVNISFNRGQFSPIYKSSKPMNIGAYKSEPGPMENFFKGDMDELRLWKTARTAEEINTWKNATLKADSNLIGYYRMEDGVSGENKTITNSSFLGSDLDGTTTGTSNTPKEVLSCASTSVEDVEKGIKWSVYPNPTSGELNIEFEKIESNVNVKIVDLSGKVISSSDYEYSGIITDYITALANGVYFVVANTANGVYSQRIIKH